MTQDLYQNVVSITEEYLGPAAERFVARQIRSHLDKHPTEIEPSDIPLLVEWTKLTLSLLTEDRKLVDEYGSKMTSLGV